MKENKPTDKPDGFSEFVQSFQTPDELQEGLNPVWCDIISEEITDPETIKKEVSSLKKTAEGFFKNHKELMKVCPDGSIKEALQPLADAREYLSGINPKTAGRHELINLLAFVVVSEGLNDFFIVTQVYEIRKDETSEPITNFARYAAKQLLNFNTEIKLTRYSVCADLCENDSLNRSFIGNLEEPIRIVRESHAGFSDALDMVTNEELGKFLESVLLKQNDPNAYPYLNSVLPQKVSFAHDMGTKTLTSKLSTNDPINPDGIMMTVQNENPKAHKKKIETPARFTLFDVDESVKIRGRLTPYHQSVLTGVYSCFDSGNPQKSFTAEMVYRNMNGMRESENVKDTQLEPLKEALYSMFHVFVQIDATPQAIAQKWMINGEPIKSYDVEGALIPATKTKMRAGNKIVETYIFDREPILLDYAKKSGLLARIEPGVFRVRKIDNKAQPGELASLDNLDKFKVVNLDKRKIEIRTYLISRIEDGRLRDGNRRKNYNRHLNQKRRNPKLKDKVLIDTTKIRYDTIFHEIGLEEPTPRERRNCIIFIRQCFEYWAAIGYIKSYVEYKEGKKYVGIEFKYQ